MSEHTAVYRLYNSARRSKTDWFLLILGAGLLAAAIIYGQVLPRTWDNGYAEGTQQALGIMLMVVSVRNYLPGKPKRRR